MEEQDDGRERQDGRGMGIRKGVPEGANPRAAGKMEEKALKSATACTKALGQGHGVLGQH